MKTLVILSGGMDSAVLLAHCLNQNEEVSTLNFAYGSKHNERERMCAMEIATYYKVPIQFCDLDFVGQLFKSDLLKTGGDIPEGHYEQSNMSATVVPFRNTIMLSIACGVAESKGLGRVCFGAHTGDHRIYPDCRPEFVNAFNDVALWSSEDAVHLSAPFIQKSKADIVLLGIRLGVPFEKTYSCYKGGIIHCGVCGTCVERREAFYLAGFGDPTGYQVSWAETVRIGGLKI